LFPKKQQYLSSFMNGAYVGGGLGKYDIDDLRAALAGSTAQPMLYASTDHFGGSGAVVSKDLERQMQLVAAYLADPGKREEAVRLFRRGLPEYYSRLDATPQSALGVAIGRTMNADDPRFTVPDQKGLTAADFAELDRALGDALATNRLEIGLTGAIDEDAAIAIVAKTFGALPKRKIDPQDYTGARKTAWSGATGNHDVAHRGEANQLSWRRVWTTTDASDSRTEQSMQVFASMVQIRLIEELRERLGKTYGVFAGSSMSRTYPGRGTFTIATDGDPKDLAAIEAAVDTVMAELLAAMPDDDLFIRARKPTLEAYADWKKQNGTWSDLVARAQTDADMLQRFRDSEAQFKSLTAEEVLGTARRWLLGKQAFTFRALPETP
jgi:zinc protease